MFGVRKIPREIETSKLDLTTSERAQIRINPKSYRIAITNF